MVTTIITAIAAYSNAIFAAIVITCTLLDAYELTLQMFF